MRRSDRRDSRTRFFAESLPRLHFAGLYLHPRDLRGFRGYRAASPDGNYVERLAIRRPAKDVVAGFEPRYGPKDAPFERPNPTLSIGSAHRRSFAVG